MVMFFGHLPKLQGLTSNYQPHGRREFIADPSAKSWPNLRKVYFQRPAQI
jgi:hypothetical protein